jgi:hypothetical protein
VPLIPISPEEEALQAWRIQHSDLLQAGQAELRAP